MDGRNAFGTLIPLPGEPTGGCSVAFCGGRAEHLVESSQVRNYYVCRRHSLCTCGRPAIRIVGSVTANTARAVCDECL